MLQPQEDEDVEESEDPYDDDIERQISDNTGALLDLADEFDFTMANTPRNRRPTKNQGPRGAAPKLKPGQKVHHREVKKIRERQAARDEKAASDITVFGTARGERVIPPSSSSNWCPLPLDRNDVREQQRLRQDNDVVIAQRAHGAPLLSATALGMDDATYRLLMDLQFRDITPEDYQTLTVLDETVKPKALENCKLDLFPTQSVVEGENGTLEVVAKDGSKHSLHIQSCLVCLESFAAGDEVRNLSCGHSFHRECIDEWFERSTRCPSDNVEIA